MPSNRRSRPANHERLVQEFWSRVYIPRKNTQRRTADTEKCWPWTGPLDKEGVYGQWRKHPWSRVVHRLALMFHEGRWVGRDQVAHHTCYKKSDHTPLCCNPHHLEWMDDAEHRSMHSKERWEEDRAGIKPFRKKKGMGVK